VTSTRPYPSRTARRAPGERRVTPRDLLVLRLVGLGQPVAAGHVERLVGCSGDVARRRLRALRDLGLVAVHVPHGLAAPSRFTLTEAGVERLGEVFGEGPWRAPRGIGDVRDFAHHDVSVDLFVALELAASRRITPTRLARFIPEAEIRREARGRSRVAVPDAVAVLEVDGVRQAIALEADTGSERPPAVVAKLEAYARARASGTPIGGTRTWLVTLVVPSERRLVTLASALCEAGVVVDELVRFAVGVPTDRQILNADAWRRLDTVGDEARLVDAGILSPVTTNRHNGRDGLGLEESAFVAIPADDGESASAGRSS
jgi:hypothetical protein